MYLLIGKSTAHDYGRYWCPKLAQRGTFHDRMIE